MNGKSRIRGEERGNRKVDGERKEKEKKDRVDGVGGRLGPQRIEGGGGGGGGGKVLCVRQVGGVVV